MKRRRTSLRGPITNDYQELATIASKEMRKAVRKGDETAGRQAVNKAYLATVHAARSIIECSPDGSFKNNNTSARSTRDMGRVQTLIGQRKLRDEQVNQVLRAFSRATGQHTACFYDGLCEMTEMADTVKFVRKALKHVPHTCERIRRSKPPNR
jgi:hypothetical protein